MDADPRETARIRELASDAQETLKTRESQGLDELRILLKDEAHIYATDPSLPLWERREAAAAGIHQADEGMIPLTVGDPSQVGDYQLLGRLGEGAVGPVYVGVSQGGGRVAIKILRHEYTKDQDSRRRFAGEVAAARKVVGVYTAPVVDADPEAEPPWMAAAYVPGLVDIVWPDTDQSATATESSADATLLRMLLGAQLRRLREAAGISAEKAGYEIRASRSKISRMESGRIKFKVRDVEDLLTRYGVVDERERAKLLALTQQSSESEWWTRYNDILPDWFETYLGLESAATAIRCFESQFVPGLFQTEDYARAVTRLGHQAASEGEIERRVGLRLGRQEVLARRQPPQVWAVMDEAVLRRPTGGAAVMRAQLARLVEAARLPFVKLQVVPFACGGHAGASGSFSILRFDERDLPDVVYMEQLTSAVYLDQHQDVKHYWGVLNQLSVAALPPTDSIRFIEQAIKET
jgi:transcriptional regulator with XRE-family HTH domain